MSTRPLESCPHCNRTEGETHTPSCPMIERSRVKLIEHGADDTVEEFARDLAAASHLPRGVDSHPVYAQRPGTVNPSRRTEGDDIEALEGAAIAYSSGFVTKDSGKRAQLAGGMVRDTNDGKPRYDLIPLLPLRRLAELYARGAQKYEARNWEKACDNEALDRFKESALRHMMQALEGDRTEDHLSAVVFNVFGWLWLEDKLAQVF